MAYSIQQPGERFAIYLTEEAQRDVPLLRIRPSQAVLRGGESQPQHRQAVDHGWRQRESGKNAHRRKVEGTR